MRSKYADAECRRIVDYIREEAAKVLAGGVSGELDLDRSEFAAAIMEELSDSLEQKEHWIKFN